MELIDAVYALPFSGLLRPPQLKVRTPTLESLASARPAKWTVFALICLSYFLVTGGIIYGKKHWNGTAAGTAGTVIATARRDRRTDGNTAVIKYRGSQSLPVRLSLFLLFLA